MEIKDMIKKARTERELTQEQAAETLLVSRQTISNWETGKSLPDIVSIIKMSELYQTSLDELLKGDPAMLQKIEKDVKIVKAHKSIIKYAFISIIMGIIILILGEIFENNPVIEFLSGAAPWVLLGLSFLFAFLYLEKLEE